MKERTNALRWMMLPQIQSDADLLLAHIATDFSRDAENGWIQLTKTQLTAKYAPHPGRKNGWTISDLYLKFIPDLIHRGKSS
jgi:hypothetical protein